MYSKYMYLSTRYKFELIPVDANSHACTVMYSVTSLTKLPLSTFATRNKAGVQTSLAI